LKSFKKGSDLDLVHGLNILSEEYKNKFKNNREAEIKKWEITLGKEDFELKALENVAKSDANYFVVNLEDLWGEEMPQNIPGTWKEYPNWRKKFAIKNSEIKENPTTKAALTVLKEFRG
jgi:4-alpha-glucanotransferase